MCDQVGGKLEAHHVKTVRDYPELELDVDNGATLCKACHKEIHKGPRRSEYPVWRNEAAMFHK
jgi:predicted HNH restriction endonuclease